MSLALPVPSRRVIYLVGMREEKVLGLGTGGKIRGRAENRRGVSRGIPEGFTKTKLAIKNSIS